MTTSGAVPGIDLRAVAREGTVHFMGISGAGMSALAELIVRSGGTVTGCDLRPGAAAAALGGRGVPVHAGHDVAHVADAAALVVTSAVPAQHAEIEAARARGIPVMKRAQALGSIVNSGVVLALAGTHGKTTTTAATTAILDAAGIDPTGIVGGHVQAWGGGLRAGRDEVFVVEADEYDRSFMTLTPDAAVVTNLEADHLDIYGDIAGLVEGFTAFLGQVRAGGLVALCSDDAGAAALADKAPAGVTVLKYGTSEDADLRAVDVQQEGRSMTFTVVEQGSELGRITVGAPGLHNVRNALGAFAAARHAGATFDAARTALRSFSGVSRRFQELGNAADVTFVDDYAHHPTEIEATLSAARGTYPGRRIVAAFQPHLYSRTRDHVDAFGKALASADVVWVCDVYAAREQPIEGVNGELVVRAVTTAGGPSASYAATLEELSAALRGCLSAGDVLVAMGAGDIDEMTRALFAQLAGRVDS
ncbi:MAG TPA: UDP-N-acetylmuramate--L-alanine ligase [Longimicrobiales bacterium]|nr:UDP-N-acetylmuramate--L-alanine ligase [Longimicrobiales bacterium]